MHPSAMPRERLLDVCDVTRSRRSGPGGQHRNKVETAIRITYRPTETTAEASERRSQAANLDRAVFRLRVNLALELRCPVTSSPSELWQRRCRGQTIAVSVLHEDFPAMLAEALDELAAANWNIQDASGRLNCTASQLTKLLRKEPRALPILNRHRHESGLPSLR